MLVQSHLGQPDARVLSLLPALPPSWKNGSVRGMRARGGFTLDMTWQSNALREARVTADMDNTLRLKLPCGAKPLSHASYTVADGVLVCALKAGETVSITFTYPSE
jgi:alpha-L-fucosidase 2